MRDSGPDVRRWPIFVADDQIGAAGPFRDDFLDKTGRPAKEFVFSSGRSKGTNDESLVVQAVREGWPFPDGGRWSMVLLDVQFPGDPAFGFRLLERLREEFGGDLPIVMLTNEDEARRKESGKLRADGFLPKELLSPERLEQTRSAHGLFPDESGRLLGESMPLLLSLRDLRRFSESGLGELLLLGETGTGKTELGEFVHRASGRPGEYVKWTADPVNKELHYDQLFGHWAGAHSEAKTNLAGRSERAHLGTLFVDEVAELAPETQIQLLEFRDRSADGLRRIQRLGAYREGLKRAGSKPSALDVRGQYDPEQDRVLVDVLCVFATNRDLTSRESRQALQFRDDLYQGLGQQLTVPPLRERRGDVVPLFQRFLRVHRHGGGDIELEPAVQQRLEAYDWPGNIRELRNAAGAVHGSLGRDFSHVFEHHLPAYLRTNVDSKPPTQEPLEPPPSLEPPESPPPKPIAVTGELVRLELAGLRDRVAALRRAVVATSTTWRRSDQAFSPARTIEHALSIGVSSSDAKKEIKRVLQPVFSPNAFQIKKWDT